VSLADAEDAGIPVAARAVLRPVSLANAEDAGIPLAALAAQTGLQRKVLPLKSKDAYLIEGQKFTTWRLENSYDKEYSEEALSAIVSAYYVTCEENYVANSLFSKFSMLRKALYATDGFSMDAPCWNICTQASKATKKAQETKKAKTISPDDLANWVINSTAEPTLKLALVLGYMGAMRPCEVYSLKLSNCSLTSTAFTYSIPERKTLKSGAIAAWVIPSSVTNWCSPVALFNKVQLARQAYIDAKQAIGETSDLSDILFYQMRDGKLHGQRHGIKTLSNIPRSIAEFCELEGPGGDYSEYTGYTIRRTSATTFAERGATAHQLRVHLGHSSDATAVEYVDSSVAMKQQSSLLLAGAQAANPVQLPTISTGFVSGASAAAVPAATVTYTGCVFNFSAAPAHASMMPCFAPGPPNVTDHDEPAAKLRRGL
jgi:integrase